MPSVSYVISHILSHADTRFIFGVPGGENIDLMENARAVGIDYVLTKREGNAAFMADMYGQLTGRPGVCLSTLGPGSTNLPNGVANAFLDRSPMLALTAQVHRHRLSTWTHQNIDHLRLFAPISKLSAAISSEAAGPIMRRAMRVATAPRPGPVHLDLSSDVAQAEAELRDVDQLVIREVSGPDSLYGAEQSGFEHVAERMRHSRRPLVVAGMSAARRGASDALVSFAEAWSLPVITTAKSKGVMPEDHALFAGVIDMAVPAIIAEFMADADLILAVGFDAVELIKDWTFKAPTIHIDVVPNTDQVYPADTEIVGNIAATLTLLTEIRGVGPRWDEAAIRNQRAKVRRQLVNGASSRRLLPHQIVLACREVVDDDALVTVDVGSHKLLVGQLWQALQPQTVFQSNGLSAMGFAFPGALAAKLLRPERQVICFTGDGGFSMAISELEVAVQLKLAVVAVVFSDGSLNRIQLKQQAKGLPTIGTNTMKGHLARVAEAYGANGFRVSSVEALQAALHQALTTEGPSVIEAVIDPSEYAAQF